MVLAEAPFSFFLFLALCFRDDHILSMKCPCHGVLSLTGPMLPDHLKLTHISDVVYSRRSFYMCLGVHCARTLSGHLSADVRFSTCTPLLVLKAVKQKEPFISTS